MRFLIIASLLLLPAAGASAMGSTQFGTYSQAYLDQQKCRAQTPKLRCTRHPAPAPKIWQK